MLFGRHRRSSPSQHAIIEFWQWWPAARSRLTASIDAGDGGSQLAAEIGQRVAAIHPELDWELGRGVVARHSFMLSPAGRSDPRATAARWLALAPPADDTWEYHDARRAVPAFATMRVRLDGHDLGVGDTRFGVTRHEHSIDVAVFHPLVAELPEQPRTRIAFLCLDWALGEQAVETWVGAISATPNPPAQADTVDGLRQSVADLAARHEEPQWLILRGGTPQTQDMMAVAQAPLRPARWPRFDIHAALTLPYEGSG